MWEVYTRVRLRFLWFLLVVAAAAFVFDLDGSSIWDANEAYYVETPREMLERGDFVSPTFNYEPRLNKPALSYWIVASLYRVLGVELAVERAVIAGFALVIGIGAFWLGRLASTYQMAGVIAALGLAANPRFFMFARRILIDVMLTAFMTLVLLFFALAERYPQHRRKFLLAMYVAGGFGVLAKGPVAVALPGLVVGIYLLMTGGLHRLRTMMIPAGAIISLAIVLPWYVALYARSGWTHITGFFVGENLDRYATIFGPEGRGPLFYVPILFADSLPWSLCLPAIVALWLEDRRSRRTDNDMQTRTLLLLWIGVIVLFFSFSQTKQDLYILPVIAAVAALGGDFVARAVANRGTPGRWLSATLIAAAVLLAAVGGLCMWAVTRSNLVSTIDGVRLAGFLAAVGALAVAISVLRGELFAGVISLLVTLIAANWTMALRVLPSFEAYKPVVPFSEILKRHAQRDDVIVQLEAAMPSMVFYLRRHVDIVEHPDAVRTLVSSGKPVHAIMPEHRYEALRTTVGVPMCVLDRRPIADVKLRTILQNEAPPMLVLVSTRCQ